MRNRLFWALLAQSLLVSSVAKADISSRLNITTQDGTINTFPYKAKFTNGSVTDNGDGTVSIAAGSGIVSPGSFTWTNNYGISGSTLNFAGITVSTITASSATIRSEFIQTLDQNSVGLTIQGTGNGTTATAPNGIANLEAWWQPSGMVSTPANTDGANMFNWPDSTGNGHILNPVASHVPVFYNASHTINGYSVFKFGPTGAGSAMYYTVMGTNVTITRNNWSMVVVALPYAADNPYGVITLDEGAGNTSGLMTAFNNSSSEFMTLPAAGGGFSSQSTQQITVNQPVIFGFSSGVSNTLYMVNGNTDSEAAAASGSTPLDTVGALQSSNLGFSAYISEIVIYTRALTSSEMLSLQAYYANKYNITITNGTGQLANLQDWNTSTGATAAFVDGNTNIYAPKVTSPVIVASGTVNIATFSGSISSAPITMTASGSDVSIPIQALPKGINGPFVVGPIDNLSAIETFHGSAAFPGAPVTPIDFLVQNRIPGNGWAGATVVSASSDGTWPYFEFLKARGSLSSPLSTQTGDRLGELAFVGYGTSYGVGSPASAFMDADVIGAGQASRMKFTTTDNAGVATTPAIFTSTGTIFNNGVVASTVTLSNFLQLGAQTKAQLQALATAANQVFACSDCVTDAACISTATLNSFVRLSSRTVTCQ